MAATTEKKRLTKRRVFDIIQLSNVSDAPSRIFDYFLVGVILANTLVMFLETFDSLAFLDPLFTVVEIVTLVVFCVEYALRLWTAEFLFPTRSRWKAVLRFMVSFDGVVELLAILPFFFLSGAVVFRMLRVVRIFHLFRINATYDSFNVITSVLKDKRNQIVSSVFIVLILMLASSLCMYSVEHEAQPDKFTNALSGMWWSVSALLTVGYGDVYPITVLGKVMAVVISFLGVGAVAIPTGIISAGFVEQYTKVQGGSGTFDSSVVTLSIDIDSRWLGWSPQQLKKEQGVVPLMVRRDGEEFQPGAEYRVEVGDVLCVYRRRREAERHG